MAAKKTKKTIQFNFSPKHKDYIRNCRDNMYNVAEGAIRAGKTVDNIFAFAVELMDTKDRIHLATGSTVANAKLNIGDANGFGLEYIFRGQCRWAKYKDNEALIINGRLTNYQTRIVIFAGAGKADSYKKIRGNSYGMWIATEINIHHDSAIKEAFNRTAAAYKRKFFWDLNPDHPNAKIYTDYIDKYAQQQEEGQLLGGYNYQHFTIDDNINIPPERIEVIKSQYDPATVWYQRDILGRRMVAEGLIYRTFANSAAKFITAERRPLMTINVGVDFGGSGSKHAFVATGITAGYNELVILKSKRTEPDDTEALIRDFMEFIDEIILKYGNIDAIYVDSAEQVLKKTIQNELLKRNINIAVKDSIKNPIIDRIRITNQLIVTGRILLTEGSCDTLKDALTMAVWDPKDTTKNERLDDGTSDIDTLDAFEYSFERYIKALTFN